jgi:hypothetical protein
MRAASQLRCQSQEKIRRVGKGTHVYEAQDEEARAHSRLPVKAAIDALVGSDDGENEGDGDKEGELDTLQSQAIRRPQRTKLGKQPSGLYRT